MAGFGNIPIFRPYGGGSSTGESGINYVTNGKGESGTTGWTVYDDSVSGTPSRVGNVLTLTGASVFYNGLPIRYTAASPVGGLTSGNVYYIIAQSSNDFSLASTIGGAAITLSGTPSGTHAFSPLYPISGGGSGSFTSNISFAVNTSNPLRSTQDFLLSKTNGTVASGAGVSYSFTIANEDLSAILRIFFGYIGRTGWIPGNDTTTTSQLQVYIIQNPGSTNQLIQPIPYNLYAGLNVPSKFFSGFQTDSTINTYRLCFHVTDTTTNSWSIQMDDILVGPSQAFYGSQNTDWVNTGAVVIDAVTTPPTKPTGITVDIHWNKRNGPNLDGRIEFLASNTTSANAGSGVYLYRLPNNLQIDLTKITASSASTTALNQKNAVGVFGVARNIATTNAGMGWVIVWDATHLAFVTNSSASANVNVVASGWYAMTEQPEYLASYSVPIVGWSNSNSQISTDLGLRNIVVSAIKSAGSVTANTTIPTWTVNTNGNPAGVFDASTGIVTINEQGFYYFNFRAQTTSGTPTASIYVNGVKQKDGLNSTVSSSVSGGFQLLAGDLVTFRIDASLTIATSTTATYIDVLKVQSGQAFTKTEAVNARYFASSTSISGSLATVVYTSKSYDTHNAFSSSGFTCPYPGKYRIKAVIATAGTFVLNTQTIGEIQKNGVATANKTTFAGGIITGSTIDIEDQVDCLAGDILRLQVSSAAVGPTIVSSNTRNYIMIEKVD